MSNFCVDLENEQFFVYEKTLESDYLQGRFGAIPRIDVKTKSQFFHIPMKIEDTSKAIEALRALADKLEKESRGESSNEQLPLDKIYIMDPPLSFNDNTYYYHMHTCSNCHDRTRYVIKKGTSIPRSMACSKCGVTR